MGVETAIIVGAAVVAAGAGTYQAVEAREQRRSQEREMGRQRQAAENEQSRIEADERNAQHQAANARRVRQQQGQGERGRDSTIVAGRSASLGQDMSQPRSTILGE